MAERAADPSANARSRSATRAVRGYRVARLPLCARRVQRLGVPAQASPYLKLASHRLASQPGGAPVVVAGVELNERGGDRLAHLRDALALERFAQPGEGAIVAAPSEQLCGDGSHAAVAVGEVLEGALERLAPLPVVEDREGVHAFKSVHGVSPLR